MIRGPLPNAKLFCLGHACTAAFVNSRGTVTAVMSHGTVWSSQLVLSYSSYRQSCTGCCAHQLSLKLLRASLAKMAASCTLWLGQSSSSRSFCCMTFDRHTQRSVSSCAHLSLLLRIKIFNRFIFWLAGRGECMAAQRSRPAGKAEVFFATVLPCIPCNGFALYPRHLMSGTSPALNGAAMRAMLTASCCCLVLQYKATATGP